MFYYLGVDLGGGSKTFAVALTKRGKNLVLEKVLSLKDEIPRNCGFEEIFDFVRRKKVLVTAIDAPLSFSPRLEKGLRASDLFLKSLLPKKYQRWVLSYHTLMGIPLRGLLLAHKLSPYCGAILETHPRASLFFLLPEEKKYLSYKYKKEGLSKEEKEYLKKFFEEEFLLERGEISFEGADFLDALLCALSAYLYMTAPERLIFLPQEEDDLFGYGPFVIIGKAFSLKNTKWK